LIGDPSVGKSFICERLSSGKVPKKSIPTVGMEFSKKVVRLEGGLKMMTQIWDTGNKIK